MSLIKANAVQIGQSGTATQNFTLAVPSSPNGTIKLARGNSGATTQDVLSVDASGNINGLVKSTDSTTARDLATRFADVVNVKDFGAVGDGATNDTAAIQAAIDAASFNSLIYFPSGYYKISNTLTITNTRVYLVGDAMTSYIISDNATDDAIHFVGELTGLKRNISQCGVFDLIIQNTNTSKGTLANPRTGAGIKITRGSWFTINNVYVQAFPEGIIIDGGQFHTLDGVHTYPIGAGFFLPPESAFITFKGNLLDGAYQHCTNHKLVNFTMSGGSTGYSHEHSIKIKDADGITIANGNIAFSEKSHILLSVDTSSGVTTGTTPYISALRFSNIYFDAGPSSDPLTTDHNFYIPNNIVGSHRRIYSVLINNCTLANASTSAFLSEEPIFNLVIDGCDIQGTGQSGIVLTNATVETGRDNFAKTIISNNTYSFDNYTNNASASLIDFGYQANINIIGNNFGEVKQCAIRGRQSNKNISITGNTFWHSADSTFNDFVKESGFFVQEPYVVSGNSSSSINTATSLAGSKVGNKISSDVSTIDWYEETTITPTISFGGSSTGVTYSSNQGFVTRIGNLVAFTLRLVLASKGSSTGTIEIDGLTHNTVNLPASACAISITNINSTITQQIIAEVAYDGVALERKIYLYKIVSGSRVALTDADLTNISIISITGNFRT